MPHFLLVDEDQKLLAALIELLSRNEPSFRVTIATSAQEALEKIAEEAFDAIISGLDDVELQKKIQKKGKGIPFITFTDRKAITKFVSPMLQARLQRQKQEAERKHAEDALQHMIQMEKLLATISTGFINLTSDEIDTGISYSLELLGEFSGADWFSVFLLSEDGKNYSCTHSWEAESNESYRDNLQNRPVEELTWMIDQFTREKTVLIRSVSSREAQEGFSFVKSLGIETFLIAPLIRGSNLIGFLGFAAKKERQWQDEDIMLLRMAGETFANALERRKAEELLRQQKEELSEFAHAMAHDLRNHLLSIQGYADLLQSGFDESYAEKINVLAKNMSDMLQRSVVLADAGLIAEKTDEVDLGHLVQEVAKTIIPKDVIFRQEGLPTVLGDHKKLFEVFQNLFENAVTHGKASKIEVHLREGDDGFTILVSNNGVPIPAKDRKKIFERRFTTKEEGGGLGLAIVEKVVTAHGWTISLEPGPELTFGIFIPSES
ncbi:MAG: hybrid sensor histidine kinase/response regulator [Candidatus Heimdallarchaeota archaeon]